MNAFDWTLPTRIKFGLGLFDKTGKAVRGLGKRALIVTSKSFLTGGARHATLQNLLEQLKRFHVETEVFGEIEPNPKTSSIDKATTLIRNNPVRFVIALGGGSVMDAAKVIAMLAVNEGTCLEYAYTGPGKDRKKFNHALPIVCIPTLAATSSETDSYAVVTDFESKRKIVVFGDALQPTVSIIDPRLSFSASKTQTVDGAFDIITHVIESYLSSSEHSPFQDRLTEAVIETVVEALPFAIQNPHDENARSNLSWCASFALCGALSGRDGSFPIHALEHGLSAFTDMSHGRGLALLLPRVMMWDSKFIPEKIIRLNKKIFNTTSSNPLDAMNEGLVRYMKSVGAWTTLQEITKDSNEKTLNTLIQNTTEHALSIDAITELGKDPYLDNIHPITREDARKILHACTQATLDTVY